MNLDNLKAIRSLDKSQVAESIANLPKQLALTWQTGKKFKLPAGHLKAKAIVFCGMGGSNLASEMLRGIFPFRMPFILVRNYNLPAFVNKDTLVVIDSYSGNTEEAISCLKIAIKIKAKIAVITSGGELLALAKKHRLPCLLLDPKLNPSRQPRYDVGSQLGAALTILKNFTAIKAEVDPAAAFLTKLGQTLMPLIPAKNNPAKNLAQRLFGKQILIFGAEHLAPNAHILANQLNESAKQLAHPYAIPELNHHFLEALALPKSITKNTVVLLLSSAAYAPRISKRMAVTKKVLDKLKIKYLTLESATEDKWLSALEILAQGSWLSFYLAMLNNINPAQIPWVDFFKKELNK
ncbi:MAG: SIS domain-containing protein [Patescibacteria group bacterium]|jgi:glucose/mannose-6-phosphate isomerase